MNIGVIGSTGGTGLEVVKQGIARGHNITTLARHPEKLDGISGIHLKVEGDALKLDDIWKTVNGQDAIISVLGTSAAALNIISAMNQLGVKRGIWVTAWPIVATKPWFLIKFSWLMFGKHYRDMTITEQLVSKSDLNWTIVRPPRLSNGVRTGQIRIEKSKNLHSGPYSISRADLAKVLLDAAESSKDSREGVVATSLPK